MTEVSLMRIFWYIYPVLIIFACNFLINRLSMRDKYGIRESDIATPFLFIGLYFLSKDVFQISILAYVLIVLLMIAIVLAVFHAKYYGDIRYKRYFKMFWRMTFLMVIFIYLVLIIASFFV